MASELVQPSLGMLDRLRARVRGSAIVRRNPLLYELFRRAWHILDLLRIRQDRSYIHGLLFDLKGGVYRTENMAFEIPADQFPRSYRSRLYFDIYESAERALAHKWIDPGSSVLELGGCIGVVSCVVNRLLECPANHVVVEANPTLIDVLRRNRDRNGSGFKIENCIVSREPAVEFYIGGLMTGNSRLSGRGRRIELPAKTLEHLESEYDVDFDTLILDIEGGEFDFFMDNAARLKRVNLIILEFHPSVLSPEQLETCMSVLEDAGLSCVDVNMTTEVWKRET